MLPQSTNNNHPYKKWLCYGVHITVWHSLFVLCHPVQAFIDSSLHQLDFFSEVFLWRLQLIIGMAFPVGTGAECASTLPVPFTEHTGQDEYEDEDANHYCYYTKNNSTDHSSYKKIIQLAMQ